MSKRFVLTLLLLCAPSPALAQCLSWQEGFHAPGPVGRVSAVALFDAGSGPELYAGGDFTLAGDVFAHSVARWDGATWHSLGSGIYSDGGSGTVYRAPVLCMVVFDDGSGPALFVGGRFDRAGGVPANNIAKWNGSAWSALAGGLTTGSFGLTEVYDLCVYDDGNGPGLYACGRFTTAGEVPANNVARWDGTAWSALFTGLEDYSGASARAMCVHDDGSGSALYVGGGFITAGSYFATNIAKWDGTWSQVGEGLGTIDADSVSSLAVYDDGGGPKLFAGGYLTPEGGPQRAKIVAWDGASWSTIASVHGMNPSSMTAFDDGSGAALFVSSSVNSDLGLGRWDGSSWSHTDGKPDGSVYCTDVVDLGTGPKLLVGGDFNSAGDAAANRLALWDGSGWSSIPSPGHGGLPGIRALTVFDDGSGPALFAGGSFGAAGSTRVNRIAKWDGTDWTALGSGLELGDVQTTVRALTTYDDGTGPALYVGGNFFFAGGVPANRVARWDGTSWAAVGGGMPGYLQLVYSMVGFDDGSGSALYAGGYFQMQEGAPGDHIAKWDGSAWSSLVGGGRSAAVNAMAVFDDGSGPAIYVGGDFTGTGGGSHIARWDGTSWSALGSGIEVLRGHDRSTVQALCVFDDGSGPALYVGGRFGRAGGVLVNLIAKWNGTQWFALGSGIGGAFVLSTKVTALTVFDDGNGPALVVGGSFMEAGGVPARCLAKWDGATWSPFGSGVGVPLDTPNGGGPGGVAALAVLEDGSSSSLFAGGALHVAGGLPSVDIAEWRGCRASIETFCFGDGSVAPCPCQNYGATGRGCENSSATGGAQLAASGTTSPDAIVLAATGEKPSALTIFLQGNVVLTGTVIFGDGLRCSGGSLKRLYVKSAVGGSVSAPGAGDPSITARSAALGDPIAPGAVRAYQTWYRDPNASFCLNGTSNASNGVRIAW